MTKEPYFLENLTPEQIENLLSDLELEGKIDNHKLFNHVRKQKKLRQTKIRKKYPLVLAVVLITLALTGFKFYSQLEHVFNQFFGPGATAILPAQEPITITNNKISLDLVASFTDKDRTMAIVKIKNRQDLALDWSTSSDISLVRKITPVTEKTDSYFLILRHWASTKPLVINQIVENLTLKTTTFQQDLSSLPLTSQSEEIRQLDQSLTKVLATPDHPLETQADQTLMALGEIDGDLHVQVKQQAYLNPQLGFQVSDLSSADITQLIVTGGLTLVPNSAHKIIEPQRKLSFDEYKLTTDFLANQPLTTEFIFNTLNLAELGNYHLQLKSLAWENIISGPWEIPLSNAQPLPYKEFKQNHSQTKLTLSPLSLEIKLSETSHGPHQISALLKNKTEVPLMKLEENQLSSNVAHTWEIPYIDIDQVTALKINETLYLP